MQDRKKRAAAAINLFRVAIEGDCQDEGDFLASVIEREELFLECVDDDDNPITTMTEFIKSVDAENLQPEPLMASAAQGSTVASVAPYNKPSYRMHKAAVELTKMREHLESIGRGKVIA